MGKGAEFNGGIPDGVGIFWNTQRIENVKQVHVGWKDKKGHPTGSLNDAGWDKKADKSKDKTRSKQVAMALRMQMKEGTKQSFLMMTAHIKSGDKPEDEPAKKAQGQEVAQIMANSKLPVIFACDFNNAPGGIAHRAFFKELRTGHCSKAGCKINDLNNIDAKCQGNKDGHCTVCGSDWKGADTDVTSAYSKVLGKLQNTRTIQGKGDWTTCTKPTYDKMRKAEPKFTTSKHRKGGVQEDKRGKTTQTIDYVYYTSNGLDCTRVLKMPEEKIEALYMPGWKYPSDHFMICADLVLTGKQSKLRRRMAQREYSNCRDSPVMTRLLKEIIDAQDE